MSSNSQILARIQTAYDAWFRAKVQEALEDVRPAVPHDEVKSRFAKRKAAARRRDREP